MSWSVNNFRKQGYFYLDTREWCGNGDLLFNLCRMIIETNDHSEWANEALSEVYYCLETRIRWPDDMAKYVTTTNHKQTDITRDPYILFYCACIHAKTRVWIEWIKPPCNLYRPKMWAWRRYLINPTTHNGAMWLFWRYFSPTSKKEYVQVLNRYMDWAVEKVNADVVCKIEK